MNLGIDTNFTQTFLLKNFLRNHKNDRLRKLEETEIFELDNLEEYNDLECILEENYIYHRLFEQKDYDKDLLLLLDRTKVKTFAFLSSWILILCLIAMLIIPIVLTNYWLYLILILLPLSALASSPINTIFKPLFWILVLSTIFYGVYNQNYDWIFMILPLLILKFSAVRSRKIFQKTIIQSARRTELNFKFLYITGTISICNKETDELTYI
jgi:hypothetical protein